MSENTLTPAGQAARARHRLSAALTALAVGIATAAAVVLVSYSSGVPAWGTAAAAGGGVALGYLFGWGDGFGNGYMEGRRR